MNMALQQAEPEVQHRGSWFHPLAGKALYVEFPPEPLPDHSA